ncbi:MAG: PASTA domain-containing protein [Candidatus Eisenbacteria bacterium]
MIRAFRTLAIIIVLALVSFGGGILIMDLTMGMVVGKGGVETVPDLSGLPFEEATRNLEKEGLYLAVEREEPHTEIDSGAVIRQLPAAGEKVKQGRRIAVTLSAGPQRRVVPELAGERVRQARIALSGVGLGVESVTHVPHERVERDVVIASSPVAGSPAVTGEKVQLLVSLGPEPSRYLLPDLRGESLDDVRRHLRLFELPLSRVSYRSDEKAPPGVVLEQTPDPGSRVDRETSLELVVSSP